MMHVVFILNPGYNFPHTLQHFPLSDIFSEWLNKDSGHSLTVVSSNHFKLPSLVNERITYEKLPALKYYSITLNSLLIHKLFIAKIILKHKPDIILFDGLQTSRLYKSTIKLIHGFLSGRKKIRTIVNPQLYNRSIKPDHSYSSNNQLIQVFDPPGSVFSKIDYNKKNEIKEQIADGNEYFISTASFIDVKNLVFLLKCFSVVKRKLKTGMKLLLTGIDPKIHAAFVQQINQYKYKSDVLIHDHTKEYQISELIASAYAHIFPVTACIYPSGIWETVRCGVPVIIPDTFIQNKEIESPGIIFNDGSIDDLSEKMMLIYKNEIFRSNIIIDACQKLADLERLDYNNDVFRSIFRQ